MRAVDLFCGRGGWTNGLLAQGFEVWGFDINPQPEYKGRFVQCDILALTVDDLRAYAPDFAVCSSPCEQFSVQTMKHFHPKPKYPEMGIRLFNHARELLEGLGVPYVMENVRGAEKFVGKCVNHCGPFYLWGTGVPAIIPEHAYGVTKGLGDMSTAHYHANLARISPHIRAKNIAVIPLPIAQAVAELARHHCEQQEEAEVRREC